MSRSAMASPATFMALMAPGVAIVAAFFLIPLVLVAAEVANGPDGWETYLVILTNARYFESLVQTLLMSAGVTVVALILCGIVGMFLVRNRFAGRSVLIGLLTLPLSFPGTVVGFMVIMLAGRQGAVGGISNALIGEKIVFAYDIAGLFVGYLYFSIPRVILAVMASAEKLDPQLEEAARSLGAPRWRVVRDVILPGLMPGLISSGAICFATAMGAFGTAFTLATDIDVLPMVIYTEFTRNANIAVAAALSIALGVITWLCLSAVRFLVGEKADVTTRGGA
ncbi:ABC transporter permease [Thalassospira povalilytica]|uniref:ABC transporter permease n=1 Tax=Thalassospira povalilytica TaxID=732237 RepID=UPI001D19464D|nr:ABC transporter permease [Thalassospira povalilytica]MCC4241540.1 ABC transporter permease [Thalassospira povalilytica]